MRVNLKLNSARRKNSTRAQPTLRSCQPYIHCWTVPNLAPVHYIAECHEYLKGKRAVPLCWEEDGKSNHDRPEEAISRHPLFEFLGMRHKTLGTFTSDFIHGIDEEDPTPELRRLGVAQASRL